MREVRCVCQKCSVEKTLLAIYFGNIFNCVCTATFASISCALYALINCKTHPRPPGRVRQCPLCASDIHEHDGPLRHKTDAPFNAFDAPILKNLTDLSQTLTDLLTHPISYSLYICTYVRAKGILTAF